MTFHGYQIQASRTAKIQGDLSALEEGVMGLCGEAGECIELFKKFRFHGHELDKGHLIKELGDALWYIAEVASALHVDLDDVATINIDKLRARYPDGFKESYSINRKEGDI